MICPRCNKDKYRWVGAVCEECSDEAYAGGVVILGVLVGVIWGIVWIIKKLI